jgi:hypothetical protein
VNCQLPASGELCCEALEEEPPPHAESIATAMIATANNRPGNQ